MIPAILGAVKAASWVQRGIIAGVCAGVLLGAFGWGYVKGVNSCERGHLQEIASQSMTVSKHESSKSEALAKVDEKHDEQSRKNDEREKVVTHEIIRYVHDPKNKPCVSDAEYGRLIGRVEQLQRDAEGRLSRTHATTTETHELRAQEVTSHQLLLGYNDLAEARRQDLEIIEFAKDFEKTRYEKEMGFYDNIHAKQMKAYAEQNGDAP